MDCCTALLWSIGLYAIYKLLDYVYRLPKVGRITQRYVFVTGCDTGFGYEISRRLDLLGVNVFSGCLTEEGENNLRKQSSSRLRTFRLNVTDHDSVTGAYEEVKKLLPQGQGLWALINNAGIVGKIGPVEWLKIKDYNQVLDVNCLGLIDMSVTFLPLIKLARGRIVNTASVFGRTSLVGSTPYCISKYGVEAFSDAARRQLRDFGVTIHLIEPGFHKTNMMNETDLVKNMKDSFAQTPLEIQQEYGEEYVEKSIEAVIKNFVNGIVSERIEDVVQAYEHAVLGLFPRARYVVGKDAKFVWLPIQAMPEWLGDYLLTKLAKDSPKPRAVLKKQL